jgi:hypothetical protein
MRPLSRQSATEAITKNAICQTNRFKQIHRFLF